jgi:hypothetical protein
MQVINFHSEQPASQDVFPGSSHDKVASAISRHILSETPSKVIGLDGEFGSGKSSILNMLDAKLTAADPHYRVWFFDCEQNYQGSTKSNFIELFTDEALKGLPAAGKEARTLKQSRDRALGRLFEYSKNTTSRVSAWAMALVASLFFSATSFREIFALTRTSQDVSSAFLTIHTVSLLSPVLVLLLAKIWHWKVKIGGERWSLLSLFKGSTHDHINEKIEVSKEVSPLDLKQTLIEQLRVLADKHFVVILDNLDRLPKESLRSVWSDLEIFIAVAGKAENLTVIVPFCSTKVATYLKAEGDRRYDAKDFIAKKFPVVFRAPPVITSGWKDGFRQLWNHTFPATDEIAVNPSTIEQCAQLLQRHSPMASSLVTPRLQKKFINDIATTALVVGEEISLLAIAAHLLLCKYAEYSLVEILRTDGFSTDYAKEVGEVEAGLVTDTKGLLTSVIGITMETGWQIQFLQIHYLTTGDIAIAELLDTPLMEAFADNDSDALVRLTSLFGFSDAVKRLLAQRPVLASLLPTIAAAHQVHSGEWPASLLGLLNVGQLDLFGESKSGSKEFYEAFQHCRGLGLDGKLLEAHGANLRAKLLKCLNASYDKETLEQARALLQEYDLYLHAQDNVVGGMVLKRAEHLMHLLPDMEGLLVISRHDFTLEDAALLSANLQLASCSEHLLSPSPLPADSVVPALEWVYAGRKVRNGIVGGIGPVDVTTLAAFTGAAGEEEGAVVGLALATTIDRAVLNALSTLLANNASPLIKAVAAVTYIRQADAESLSLLEDLDGVLESEIFRSLGNALLSSKLLFALLTSEEVGSSIAGYLAYLVEGKKIGALQCDWIAKNFSALTEALEPYSLTEDEILEWLLPWDIHIEEHCRDILTADALLIDRVMESGAEALPKVRDSVIKSLTGGEMTQGSWVQIISGGSKQHLAVIRAIIRENLSIASTSAVSDALIEVLTTIANGETTAPWGNGQFAIIEALLETLDAQQRGVVGIRLRNLMFASSVEPDNFAVLLAKYGHLIPDIQPSNPQEVGRIILFLDNLNRHTSSDQPLASFFDARAEQIAAYKYSPEMKKMMGTAVSKLSATTPALYRHFAQAKGFVRLLQSLKRGAPDTEVE